MLDSVYYNPTKVVFGKGAENSVGEEVARISGKALLHYGGQSAEKSGLLDRVRKSLKAAGVTFVELGGVVPNPRLSLVYEGIKLCRSNGVGLVLAVGGGSVIDSAKAIACGAAGSDDVWEFFNGAGKKAVAVLPVACVLTIPGAGSESSNGMVISNEDTGEKYDYVDERSRPVLAFLNPELTYSLPPYQTAAGLCDAIIHITERYFTNVRYVDTTDRICEGLIRTLVKYGSRVIDNPKDYNIRAEIMWACKLAHDGTLDVGRMGDWASHFIEHELSAEYDVTHGAGLTVITPAWMEYVYKHDKNRFAQFAMRVFDVEYDFDNPDVTVLEGIARLKAFFKSIGMPVTLRELGIEDKSKFGALAKHGVRRTAGGTLGNFVRLDAADVEKILEIAF